MHYSNLLQMSVPNFIVPSIRYYASTMKSGITTLALQTTNWNWSRSTPNSTWHIKWMTQYFSNIANYHFYYFRLWQKSHGNISSSHDSLYCICCSASVDLFYRFAEFFRLTYPYCLLFRLLEILKFPLK